MELNVGMDVSLKETSICVVDDNGEIVSEGVVISEPATIAAYIRTTAPHAKRIGLRPRRHRQEAPRPGRLALHFVTDPRECPSLC